VISLVGGPLLGLFFLGMFTTRTNARGALWGWAAGFLTLLCVSFGKSIASVLPPPMQGAFETLGSISFLWWTLVGISVTMTVGLIASRFGPAPSPQQLKELTWSNLDKSKIGEQ
jgi:sodium-coupled monocarboxylate transporter 8/12